MSDLAAKVRRRADGVCEYCRVPEQAFRRPFHIEQVIARQHGGVTELANLVLACWVCNLKKGPNLTGIDPQSKLLTPLFNPRRDIGSDHFALSVGTSMAAGVEIPGLTAVRRTTVMVLGMNTEMRQMVRYELWREG